MQPFPFTTTRRQLLGAVAAVALPSCGRREETTIASKEGPPESEKPWLLTPGAPSPDWTLLDEWQEAITRDDFTRLLKTVLSDGLPWPAHVEIKESLARIRMATPRAEGPVYELRFADSGQKQSRRSRYWKRREELLSPSDPRKPLSDLHIVVDPGHIGGAWAQMEERLYQPADGLPVKEGDLSLRTGRVLAPMLEELGARVSWTRSGPEPLTKLRPEGLFEEARAGLQQQGKPASAYDIQKEAERLFYRAHEIRSRADLINNTLRPDLVIHLHYNAGLPGDNHLHVLAHGCIDAGEASLDDQRLDGLLRLVQQIPETEIPLCISVARRMAEATGLPAYAYPGKNARALEGEPYVWIRNLIAGRIYRCPVVYCEPYCQNNEECIARFRAGDYEGCAIVAGKSRISIFREYAAGVVAGLRDYYGKRS